MIKPHRARLASTISMLALLVGLAFDQDQAALADTSTSGGYVEDAVKRLEQQDHKAAVIQLKNALQADPDNLRARQILGEIYLEQGRFAEAEKELKRVHKETPDLPNKVSLAKALLGQNKAEDVLELIDGVRSDDRDLEQRLVLMRTEALLGLERPDDAKTALSTELDANPLDADVNLMDARISMAEGDIDSAQIKIGRALEVDQSSIHGWLLDAQVKSGRGLHQEALSSLDRADSLSPGNSNIGIMRAEVLIRRAKFEDAERIVTDVLQRSPKHVAANFLLATVQSNKGQAGRSGCDAPQDCRYRP